MKTKSRLKPPLKWVGGKTWLIPELKPIWEKHSDRRLVELFCGGMGVSFGLTPERALLNDRNPHLINFYRQVQSGHLMSAKDFCKNEKSHYYEARDEFNRLIELNCIETTTAATCFYYLNRTGFNGLCRFNSKGGYNVPFGAHKTINYLDDFSPYEDLFRGWEFVTGDFSETPTSPDDFIFADPPYVKAFTKYTAGDFGWEEQVRLSQVLLEHPGPVVATNHATEDIMELYQSLGFLVRTVKSPRRISCNGDRTPAMEMIATKNL